MTATTLGTTGRTAWTAVCHLADLVPERGAAALVDGEQVAVVRLVDDTVLAVQNLDPFSGAHVLSRGIVGSRGEAPTIASPMYKQVFDLRTGACLDPVGREPVAGDATLRTWPVRVDGGLVLVGTVLPRLTTPRDDDFSGVSGRHAGGSRHLGEGAGGGR